MGQLEPTRQEILDAHKALEELKRAALKSAEYCGDTEAHLWRTQEILTALAAYEQEEAE